MLQESDHVLVSHYIKGNEKAFEILLERHKTKVYQNIYFMVHDGELAEDIFQETFMKVIRTLKSGRYNEEGKFLPWVCRIAHNLVIDHFRREKKMRMVSGGDDYDIFATLDMEELTVEDQLVMDQIGSDVKKLMEQLPEEQKEVVQMRCFQDMSFKEIAENTGVSINTALGRMRYALINIRKMIKEHNIILSPQ
ncbi:sigma-70 family RNA polymerase sigma factor [Luteibaculum oceani]|uniref:Sigma-70 family RNA polymerase sigma factor n=1 Tax=Luteibaculum oceani TaxID=1294296 RepID=A0A5C6V1F6_9FLAO|nr:sigma-70 family RNA polymerase sigma factor [Luteibaculum oceani]TXC77148.1 sigma-70 family RNA polymerase sigma factor [Luteibaculum oceani]